MFDTPILFLVFNRPGLTRIVFNRIKEVKPKYLFIGADGPRVGNEEDKRKCEEVRSIVLDYIDWDCEVKTLFRDQNLGCRKAVNEAISWFFKYNESGIILEDDTLPDPSFFYFSKRLLEKYKNDERVFLISGFNHLGSWEKSGYSYFFSKLGAIWGWASWRRAWEQNDIDLELWPKAKDENILHKILDYKPHADYRQHVCELTYRGEIDTWDYTWTFSRLVNSGFSVVPTKNLVQNIGFNVEATHTKDSKNELSSIKYNSISANDIVHPKFVYPDGDFDSIVERKYFSGNSVENRKSFPRRSLLFRLKKKIKKHVFSKRKI